MHKKIILILVIFLAIFFLLLAFFADSFFLFSHFWTILISMHAIGLLIVILFILKISSARTLFILASGLLPAMAYLDLQELAYIRLKNQVLHASPEKLALLGEHFILKHYDTSEIDQLVNHRALGGVYLQKSFAAGLTFEKLTLRAKQLSEQGLFIASDQEGGAVNHLSPPLNAYASLQSVLRPLETDAGLPALAELAQKQADELSRAGVNLNLAPVVDLLTPENAYLDFHTSINARAISSDPELSRQAMLLYCRALAQEHVSCVRKHFPGLGSVPGDTHFFDSALNEELEILRLRDWIPFSGPYPIMVGHVRVEAFGGGLASCSARALQFVRSDLKFGGVLITDDFSMAPVVRAGAGACALHALNHGVDLILIAAHERHFYEILSYLLDRLERGQVDLQSLTTSRQRLSRLRSSLNLSRMSGTE